MKTGIPKANSQTTKIKLRDKQPKYGPIIHARPVRDAAIELFADQPEAADKILNNRDPALMALAKDKVRDITHKLKLAGVK